jgi:hypothetical protein
LVFADIKANAEKPKELFFATLDKTVGKFYAFGVKKSSTN